MRAEKQANMKTEEMHVEKVDIKIKELCVKTRLPGKLKNYVKKRG